METSSSLAIVMETPDNNNGISSELQSRQTQIPHKNFSVTVNQRESSTIVGDIGKSNVNTQRSPSSPLSNFLRHINCSTGSQSTDDRITTALLSASPFLHASNENTSSLTKTERDLDTVGSFQNSSGGCMKNIGINRSNQAKMIAEDSSSTSPRSAATDSGPESVNVSGLFEPVKCDDCKKEFRDPNMFLIHDCKKSVVETTDLESNTSNRLNNASSNEDVSIPISLNRDNYNNNCSSSKAKVSREDSADVMSVCSSLSDVETFTGKIVYNPDGSAYIIEPVDSELSEDESTLELPQQEGSIVDARGMTPPDVRAIPQIINAFHLSRSPALYNAIYGQAYSSILQEKKKVPEAPIMHSYRVFNVRDKSDNDDEEKGAAADGSRECPSIPIAALPSVPIKPILMCFVCKLSFGFAKSFVAHAMGEHKLTLIDREKELLSEKNTSAIIQVAGRSKESPLLSFLEPVIPAALKPHTSNVQGHFVTQSVNSSCSSSSVSTSAPIASLLNNVIGSSVGTFTAGGLASIASSTSAGPAVATSCVENIPIVPGLKCESVPVSSSDKLIMSSSNRSDVNSCSPVPDIEESSSFAVPSENIDFRKSPIVSSDTSSINKTVLDQQLMRSAACSSSLLQLSSSSSISTLAPTFLHNITPSTTTTSSAFSFSANGVPICSQHPDGKIEGVECPKCDLILGSSRSLGGHMTMMHSRNSCKTLKCPKCNWHYKYQETLEIHMKEKHPESETSCVYCITSQAHPRLARGETYNCGYKPYRCDVCNYSTTTKGNLSIHMQSDKHLNNMQELQNGNVTSESILQSQGLSPAQQSPASSTAVSVVSGSNNLNAAGPVSPVANDLKKAAKPKPTWRCDVCNYETNVARNLRIHMTSEKHTHNMMVLQQNVKHMQQLTALQQVHQFGADPASMLQFNPALAAHPEAALADLAYNQALMFMLGQQQQHQQQQQHHQQQQQQQQQSHIQQNNHQQESSMDFDVGDEQPDNSDSSADDSFNKMFLCAVCSVFCSDSLEELNVHIQHDRTNVRENEVLLAVAGNYICKLCSYKTNLKANFQLHCKTDKHLQKLQYINHIKEGGPQNEWKSKYTSVNNPVQIKCCACDYFTNSIHKLQLHATSPRHESSAKLFCHLRASEISVKSDTKCYYCSICQYSSRSRAHLLQHVRSVKHLRNENLHQLECHNKGIQPGSEDDIASMFVVKEISDDLKFEVDSDTKDDDLADGLDDECDDESVKDEKSASMLKQALLDPSSKPSEGSAINDYSCARCDYSAVTEAKLEAHIQSQHVDKPNKPLLLCPLCQDQFSQKRLLEKHLMQIHNVTKEGVNTLLMMIVDNSEWTANANNANVSPNNTDDEQLELKIDLGEDCIKLDDTDSKKIEDSSLVDDIFRCQMCPKMFRNFDDLCNHQNDAGHLELKQTPRGPGYLCWKKGCNQYFKTSQSLQIHFREIHVRKQPVAAVSDRHVYKFRCNQCSLAFKTLEKLQLHSQYHTIRAATKCPICARSFRSVPALQKHLASHTDLTEEEMEQFRMDLAGNPLLNASNQSMESSNSDLNADIFMKRENSTNYNQFVDEDNENLPVNFCDAKDACDVNSSNLDGPESAPQQTFEDYLNTQALAEDSYNDPSRKYKCHRCKVAFTRQSYLTSHNKTLLHRKGDKLSYPMEKYLDPSRPFKCDTCKESFTQKNILLVHFNSVSHLHKLKKSMAESNSNTSSASVNHPTSSGVGNVESNSVNNSNNGNSLDSDKKPYKCNICKVSYSQGSTLDIHMRSVLHQTRASKLQELALTGQVDLNSPLIEQPEPQKSQDYQRKVADMLHSESATPSINEVESSRPSTVSPSPVPTTSSASLSLLSTNNTQDPSSRISQSPAGIPSQLSPQHATQIFTCQRCNSIFTSQDALLTHQQLYCFFSPNAGAVFGSQQVSGGLSAMQAQQQQQNQLKVQRFSMTRSKPSLYKHLLESYGFDVVMQFNEYYQRRPKKDSEKPEEKDKETESEVKESKEKKQDETPIENDEKPKKFKIDLPEINKSTCEFCSKVFSSIWVLKAHKEEVHKKVVPFDLVKKVSEEFKGDYEKKCQNQEPECSPTPEAINPPQPNETAAVLNSMAESMNPASSMAGGMLGLDPLSNNHMAAQMPFHPLLMSMGLGLGLPLGVNPFAAMNMHHPLLPFMMPPPGVDPMSASGQPMMPNSIDPNFVLNQQKLMQQQHHQQQQQQQHQQQQQQQSQHQQLAAQVQQQGKRARTRINDDQLKILKAHFDINNSPTEEQIQKMSEQSGLPQKVIKHWFRNTLFKERQRNKDSPYNFNNPPSTILNLEEYEKTGEAKTTPFESPKDNKINNADHQPHQTVKEERHEDPSDSPMGSFSESEGRKTPMEIQEEKRDEKMTIMHQPLNNLFDNQKSAMNVNKPVAPIPKSPMFSFSHSMLPTEVASKQSVLSLLNPSLSMAASLPSPIASMNNHLPMSTSPPMSTTPTSPSSSIGGMCSSTPHNPNNAANRDHGKRANRTRFTDYQIKVLQEFFDQNAYPKDDDLEYLSKLLNLSPRVIVVWFQNARQKARKVYENQPPAEPEDDGTGRFQRTPGLNYQCKKCLLVFQRYYELIKHQKSHCFKDEEKQNKMSAAFEAKQEISRSETSTPADTNSQQATPSSDQSPNDQSMGGVFRCDKCNLVFQRFELWREHQIIHIMNPNLFPTYPPNTPFGMLQYEAQQAGQLAQQLPMKRKLSEDLEVESEENADQPRDKRLRTTILPEQLDYLYQKYQIESNPSRKMLESIAREVGLKKRVVQVWFQNTRARERKGQFRAHQQVIHKRCPFCRALFKAKSALESHLATKHPDQYTKGDINIDALPDGDLDSNPGTPPATASSSGSPPATSMGNNLSMSNILPPFFQGNTEAVQNTMKRYYEDSLKRYLDELSQNNNEKTKSDFTSGSHGGGKTRDGIGGDGPLDLSKPIREPSSERSLLFEAAVLTDTSFLSTDDARSETYSDSTDNMDIDDASNPTSPATSNTSRGFHAGSNTSGNSSGNKRYRTQMTTLQLKVMKTIFLEYKTPTMAECELLGREIGLPKRVIQVWFQNARAKEKKAKLAFAKHFGQEIENPRAPEECSICNFKYTHKYSIQDHLFTRKHLDNIKNHIDNVKKITESQEGNVSSSQNNSGSGSTGGNNSGTSEKQTSNTVAQLLRGSSDGSNGDGNNTSAAQAMAAVAAASSGGHGQPNLAQLQHMMGLQQMAAAGGLGLPGMNSSLMNPFSVMDSNKEGDGMLLPSGNNRGNDENHKSNLTSGQGESPSSSSDHHHHVPTAAVTNVTTSPTNSSNTKVKEEHNRDSNSQQHKDNNSASQSSSSLMMNPFGDLGPLMAGGSDAANLLPYMYAGFPGYYAGVPGTFIHPAMYAANCGDNGIKQGNAEQRVGSGGMP